ncbi:sensor histidine kinase [Tamaricihabitans halophyticus]|uniref:sensor histidine kinase n=1 Tax=Tamaricihabitans halophyticus TaxID=1262583 RepID=UPI003C769355
MRTKLIALLTSLLAAVCVVIGVLTEVSLHTFLMRQLDEQVAGASERAARFAGPHRESRTATSPGAADPLNAPGQAAGTLTARIIEDEVVVGGRLSVAAGDREPLNSAQRAAVRAIPADGSPRTIDLDEFGSYRLVARSTEPDEVVVTGLPLSSVNDTMINIGLLVAGVTLAGLVAAGATGAVLVRRTLRPLDRVAATASEVTQLPLDRGEVTLPVRVPDLGAAPNTEVGKVRAALNHMLGHVAGALAARHASETRVRQFVADASHELRTPLAAIRGYAELTRRTRTELPADVAYAMCRVESEAARMTELVEDLLLLARLDSGRPLASAEVELSRLVADAVNDAHIAGGEHRWLLELPPEPVTMRGDSARLHQVLANLLGNARTHTPPGTTVCTTVDRLADEVLISVVDNGGGIAAELLPNVFERFARGTSSRSRGQGSTGLGLAIVAAVVAAHRGSVEVDSAEGRTAFRVRLPTGDTGR